MSNGEEISEGVSRHEKGESTPAIEQQADPLAPGNVVWVLLEGYPWWPAFICNPFKLRESLWKLGDGHKKILRKARAFPNDFRMVYFFYSHDFQIFSVKKKVLRAWDCPDSAKYKACWPANLKNKTVVEDLNIAIDEAEDPSLPPPPPSTDDEAEKEESETEEKKTPEKKASKKDKKADKKSKKGSEAKGSSSSKKSKDKKKAETPATVKTSEAKVETKRDRSKSSEVQQKVDQASADIAKSPTSEKKKRSLDEQNDQVPAETMISQVDRRGSEPNVDDTKLDIQEGGDSTRESHQPSSVALPNSSLEVSNKSVAESKHRLKQETEKTSRAIEPQNQVREPSSPAASKAPKASDAKLTKAPQVASASAPTTNEEPVSNKEKLNDAPSKELKSERRDATKDASTIKPLPSSPKKASSPPTSAAEKSAPKQKAEVVPPVSEAGKRQEKETKPALKSMPSKDAIAQQVEAVVSKVGDFTKITLKQVREEVEAAFGVDLTSEKGFIKDQVKKIVVSKQKLGATTATTPAPSATPVPQPVVRRVPDEPRRSPSPADRTASSTGHLSDSKEEHLPPKKRMKIRRDETANSPADTPIADPKSTSSANGLGSIRHAETVKKELQHATQPPVKNEVIRKALDDLSKMEVTIELLKETQIALAVKSITKAECLPDLRNEAKLLLKKWKDLVIGS